MLRHLPCDLESVTMRHVTDLPLAAAGLTSYRCRLPFGFIMIGAIDDDDALQEALRSSPHAQRENLEVWKGGDYKKIG